MMTLSQKGNQSYIDFVTGAVGSVLFFLLPPSSTVRLSFACLWDAFLSRILTQLRRDLGRIRAVDLIFTPSSVACCDRP